MHFTAESVLELILNRALSSVAGTLFVCVHLCKCCSADLEHLEAFLLMSKLQFHFSMLQTQMTPVHMAAHLGHVEVLRVLIKGYHADKMVKATVNEYQSLLCTGNLSTYIQYVHCPAAMAGVQISYHPYHWNSTKLQLFGLRPHYVLSQQSLELGDSYYMYIIIHLQTPVCLLE